MYILRSINGGQFSIEAVHALWIELNSIRFGVNLRICTLSGNRA